MPVTRSAKKALRVSVRRNLENLRIKRLLRGALKSASKEKLAKTFSAIDKAVKFNVIHENKAGRLKAQLSKRFGSSSPKSIAGRPAKSTKKTRR